MLWDNFNSKMSKFKTIFIFLRKAVILTLSYSQCLVNASLQNYYNYEKEAWSEEDSCIELSPKHNVPDQIELKIL